jgi:16S rRNA (uracil1498-N3)-methyltransferase
MHYFFCDDITFPVCTLPVEEAFHGVKVLRLKEGDRVKVTDGKGNLANGVIVASSTKSLKIEVEDIKHIEKERNYFLQIAISPTKSIDRFEWFVEKSVEIGINRIIPVFTTNAERKSIKLDRLRKICISAIKQSQKTYLPAINELIQLNEFFKEEFTGKKLIAHCMDTGKEYIGNMLGGNESVSILIGPEGDFSEEELEKAMNQGYHSISLGDSRLRTETAGIVACHAVYMINQL